MNTNEELINRFYTSFQQKDYKGMQACYADAASFSDAVFKNLNAAQVRAMWQMLLSAGGDLRLEFKNVRADEKTGSAEWVAHYTFSRTGRKVVNRIQAHFVFEDGKIIRHLDTFSFYTWSRQAMGLSGLLLGWTSFLNKKISAIAMGNLKKFMDKG